MGDSERIASLVKMLLQLDPASERAAGFWKSNLRLLQEVQISRSRERFRRSKDVVDPWL